MIVNTRLYGGGDNDESINPSLLDGFIEGNFSLASQNLEVL